MKKVILLFLCSSLILSSCKKISDLLTFEVSNSQNIVIPASAAVSLPIISPVPVSTNSEESFENNNTKSDLVKDVILKELVLTIVDPTTENFNFLESIEIYIGTRDDDQILLASLNNVPRDVSMIELIPVNSRLDKYIKASSYTLYTKVSVRSNVSKELTVRTDSKFNVTADPF